MSENNTPAVIATAVDITTGGEAVTAFAIDADHTVLDNITTADKANRTADEANRVLAESLKVIVDGQLWVQLVDDNTGRPYATLADYVTSRFTGKALHRSTRRVLVAAVGDGMSVRQLAEATGEGKSSIGDDRKLIALETAAAQEAAKRAAQPDDGSKGEQDVPVVDEAVALKAEMDAQAAVAAKRFPKVAEKIVDLACNFTQVERENLLTELLKVTDALRKASKLDAERMAREDAIRDEQAESAPAPAPKPRARARANA